MPTARSCRSRPAPLRYERCARMALARPTSAAWLAWREVGGRGLVGVAMCPWGYDGETEEIGRQASGEARGARADSECARGRGDAGGYRPRSQNAPDWYPGTGRTARHLRAWRA